jgi:hypothetical protein
MRIKLVHSQPARRTTKEIIREKIIGVVINSKARKANTRTTAVITRCLNTSYFTISGNTTDSNIVAQTKATLP